MDMDNINHLIEKIGLTKGDIVSIIGSGGKTTLLRSLTKRMSERLKVAALTTTKIFYPRPEDYTKVFIGTYKLPIRIKRPGVYYFASEYTNGKLSGLSGDIFLSVKRIADIMIIEADGSAGKLLKGWAGHEPVIVRETTVTIGIIPITAIGQRINDETIHRLPLFLKLTDGKKGDVINRQHLIDIINHRDGLFRNAKGRLVLYISQADREADRIMAEDMIPEIREDINKIVIGSIHL